MRKILGLIFIVAGGLGLWWAASGADGFPRDFSFGMKELHLSESAATDGIEKIVVESGSTNIEVVKGGGDRIVARLDGRASRSVAKEARLTLEPTGETLKIGVQMPDGFAFNWFRDVDLRIELPEKRWNELRMHTGSGNIELAGVSGASLQVEVSSGNIDLERIEGDEIRLESGSGDVNLVETKARAIDVDVKSGNICVDRYESDSVSFFTGSGDVTLTGGTGKIGGQTSSGNIKIETAALLHDVDLKTGSGDIRIETSEAPASLTVDYEGGSGSGKVNWDGFVVLEQSEDRDVLKGTFGAGEVMLKARTGSGNFTLGRR